MSWGGLHSPAIGSGTTHPLPSVMELRGRVGGPRRGCQGIALAVICVLATTRWRTALLQRKRDRSEFAPDPVPVELVATTASGREM